MKVGRKLEYPEKTPDDELLWDKTMIQTMMARDDDSDDYHGVKR